MTRGTYYGAWKRLSGAADFLPRKAVVLFDVEASYDFTEQFGLDDDEFAEAGFCGDLS